MLKLVEVMAWCNIATIIACVALLVLGATWLTGLALVLALVSVGCCLWLMREGD